MTDGPFTIARLDAAAQGVAPGPDGPIRIARALPGEVVTGIVAGVRIADPRILEPAPERVAPPCPHFRRCGGCALQHASDAFVAGWKARRVTDALRAAGVAGRVGTVRTSPPRSRRRAALKGRKTKKGALVGLHAARSHDLVAIPDCRLLHPDLMAVLPDLEALTRRAAPRGGEIGLHVTRTATGVDLSVTGAKAADDALLPDLARAFARVTWNGAPLTMTARPEIVLGPARVAPPPGAFLQATASGEAALRAAVRDIVFGTEAGADAHAGPIGDLFAGLGTFALDLARDAPVTAWEGDGAALDALAAAHRATPGLRPIATRRRDLFRDPVRAEEMVGLRAAVVDPPRAGAAAQFAELARSDLSVIAAVSCDPDTFARDAAILTEAAWRMGPVAVVDQFRWSAHVELVAGFRRDTGLGGA